MGKKKKITRSDVPYRTFGSKIYQPEGECKSCNRSYTCSESEHGRDGYFPVCYTQKP